MINRNEKFHEQNYKGNQVRTFANKLVEYKIDKSKQIQTQIKESLVSSSVKNYVNMLTLKVNVHNEQWNEKVSQEVKREKESWLNMLKANGYVSKERCIQICQEEIRKIKNLERG